MTKIAIIDYGVGNIYSLARAFKFFGVEALVTEDPKILEEADGVVLPGVGSFEAGMRGLELRGLIQTVKNVAEQNKPMLGICLGAQLMMTEGYEFGVFKGLDIIKGKVVHFPPLLDNEKVPQVGWNTLSSSSGSFQGTILDSFDIKDHVYFVHSYILEPALSENSFAMTSYGGHKFSSAIRKGNIYGVQFHPEKSGQVGLKLIKNFIDLTK